MVIIRGLLPPDPLLWARQSLSGRGVSPEKILAALLYIGGGGQFSKACIAIIQNGIMQLVRGQFHFPAKFIEITILYINGLRLFVQKAREVFIF